MNSPRSSWGLAPHLKPFAPFPVSVAYVDITTWCGSLYRLGLGRYIDRGRVVISSVRWSIYRQVPTRSIGSPKSICQPHGLLRAITRLPLHSRQAGFWKSARRYGRGRPADRVGVGALTYASLAGRPGHVGPPRCPRSASRHCRRPRAEALSALLDETLRPTWLDSPPCSMRLSALLASK